MPFTPGQWTIEVFPASDCDDGNACTAITARANEDGKEGFILAEVNRWAYGDGPATEESDANARLICAAPALLAACKEAQHVLGDLAAELCEHPDYRNYFSSGHGLKVYGDLAAAITLAENSADCS